MLDRLRRWLAPVLAVVALAVLGLAAGYFTRSTSKASLPDYASPTGSAFTVRGVVQSASGNELRLKTEDGEVTLKLSSGAPIERLRPTTLGSIRTGDWVNAGGVPHAQTLFALVGVVVIPQSLLESPR